MPSIHLVYDGTQIEIAHRQHNPKQELDFSVIRELNRLVLQWARFKLGEGEGGFKYPYCTYISAKMPTDEHPNQKAESQRKKLAETIHTVRNIKKVNYTISFDVEELMQYDDNKGWKQSYQRDEAIIRAIDATKSTDWLVVGTVDNDPDDTRFKQYKDSIRKAIERRNQPMRTAQLWCESPPEWPLRHEVQNPGTLIGKLVDNILRVSLANGGVALADANGYALQGNPRLRM